MPRALAATIAFTFGLGLACSRAPEFSWRPGAPCPIARFEAMGAAVRGQVVVLGGFFTTELAVTSSVQVYDPVGDRWRSAAPLPSAQTHVGVALDGDDLALAGGFVGQIGRAHV